MSWGGVAVAGGGGEREKGGRQRRRGENEEMLPLGVPKGLLGFSAYLVCQPQFQASWAHKTGDLEMLPAQYLRGGWTGSADGVVMDTVLDRLRGGRREGIRFDLKCLADPVVFPRDPPSHDPFEGPLFTVPGSSSVLCLVPNFVLLSPRCVLRTGHSLRGPSHPGRLG